MWDFSINRRSNSSRGKFNSSRDRISNYSKGLQESSALALNKDQEELHSLNLYNLKLNPEWADLVLEVARRVYSLERSALSIDKTHMERYSLIWAANLMRSFLNWCETYDKPKTDNVEKK